MQVMSIYYVYRGVKTKGPDFMTGLPRQFKYDDLVIDIGGIPTHVGGLRLSAGSEPHILLCK